MGEYFYLINVNKKQWVNPHLIGNGLKLGEQTGHKYSTMEVAKLLVAPEPDLRHPLIGSWASDADVGFVGDENGAHAVIGRDLPEEIRCCAETLHMNASDNPEWIEISASVREMMSAVFGITYTGTEWLDIVEPDGSNAEVPLNPDIILRI